MAISVDVAPTLLQLAGLKIPEAMQGISLSPVLANKKARLRNSIHLEHFKDFPYNVPAWDAVRTDHFLYVEYEGQKDAELFDIQKDRRTMHNLIATPEGKSVLPELQEMMKNYLRRKTNG